MNQKIKLLRLLALALLRVERAVSAVSLRVGQYTLSKYADQLAEEEDAFYDTLMSSDLSEEEFNDEYDEYVALGTKEFNSLASELNLEEEYA